VVFGNFTHEKNGCNNKTKFTWRFRNNDEVRAILASEDGRTTEIVKENIESGYNNRKRTNSIKRQWIDRMKAMQAEQDNAARPNLSSGH